MLHMLNKRPVRISVGLEIGNPQFLYMNWYWEQQKVLTVFVISRLKIGKIAQHLSIQCQVILRNKLNPFNKDFPYTFVHFLPTSYPWIRTKTVLGCDFSNQYFLITFSSLDTTPAVPPTLRSSGLEWWDHGPKRLYRKNVSVWLAISKSSLQL